MKIYLAGPLYTKAEQQFNIDTCNSLETMHDVFLPQFEGEKIVGPCADWPRRVFEIDRNGIDAADVVVAIMDGTQVDDGTAWECGYAYATGKPIIGLRTDFRKVGDGDGQVNLMLQESAVAVVTTLDEVKSLLYEIAIGK